MQTLRPITDWLLHALNQWGWLVVLLAVLIAFSFAWAGANPVKEVGRGVESIATGSGCPDGWKATTESSEHTIVRQCKRDNFIALLDDDGKCAHIGVKDRNDFIIDFLECAEVPGWPAGR